MGGHQLNPVPPKPYPHPCATNTHVNIVKSEGGTVLVQRSYSTDTHYYTMQSHRLDSSGHGIQTMSNH